MAKKVTQYEIKGLLHYYLQSGKELPDNPEPRVLYCLMKDNDLLLREENTQYVIITVKTEGAKVTMPSRSLAPGFFGVCVQCVGETSTHHFLWKSAEQRDQKFAVLLRSSYAIHWPKSKTYDPKTEAHLLEVGTRSFFEVPPLEKKLLLLQKLQLCSIRFDWSDPSSNAAEKDIKTCTLHALVQVSHHMNELNDCRSFKDMLRMIGCNLFRALPSVTGEVPAEADDEDVDDPAWVHLQLVYEILHKIYNSTNISDLVRKKSTTVNFLSKMVELFHSRDHRERECLKQTAHRMYGRLTNRRAAIRKIFNYVFAREIYEPMPNYRGISEILDILASIINGFACPIKEEHKKMLYRYLIPLHKLPNEHTYYQQQLHYCMILFAGKDHTFTVDIIRGILKYWPVGNNPKEQQFLQELEDLFEYVEASDFEKIHDDFLRRFVILLEAPHFQTTERALWFWRNPTFYDLAVTHQDFGRSLLKALFEPLQKNTLEHWNESVKSMSEEILQHYENAKPDLYAACVAKYNAKHSPPTEETNDTEASTDGSAGGVQKPTAADLPK